jgi:radical SAM superfamily enzyme YgiQ (UPF0313 family)
MKLALVIAPLYSRFFAPLGLAYLNAVLRKDGYETVPWDLEFLMQIERPGLYEQVKKCSLWSDLFEAVNFLIDPELLLLALFTPPERLPVDGERGAFVREAREYAGRLAERVLAGRPRAVLLSTFIGNVLFSLIFARAIRVRDPGVAIITGGPGLSTAEVQEIALRSGVVDCCVTGEGEDTIRDVLASLDGCELKESVPGAAFLREEQFTFTPRSGRADLADLPYPDFHGFPFPGATIRQYLRLGFGGMPVLTSRGCPARCVFCTEQAFWRTYRARSPEAVVDEIAHQEKTYGYDLFHFCDSLINADRDRLERLCDALIRRSLDIFVPYAFCRPANLDAPLLRKMARAGFRKLDFGVESGSSAILHRMGKGISRDVALRVVVEACEAIESVEANIIAFFPGESRDETLESIRFIFEVHRRLKEKGLGDDSIPQWSFNWIHLEPLSRLYREHDRFGIALEPFEIAIPPGAERMAPYVEKILIRWRNPGLDMEEKLFRTALFGSCPARHRDDRLHRSLLPKAKALLRESSRFFFQAGYKLLETCASSTPGDEGRLFFLQGLEYLFGVGSVEREIVDGLRCGRNLGEMVEGLRCAGSADAASLERLRDFLGLLLCLEIIRFEDSTDMYL